MNKNIKKYLASIGAKGGSVKSEAKKKATAESLKKARDVKKKGSKDATRND